MVRISDDRAGPGVAVQNEGTADDGQNLPVHLVSAFYPLPVMNEEDAMVAKLSRLVRGIFRTLSSTDKVLNWTTCCS